MIFRNKFSNKVDRIAVAQDLDLLKAVVLLNGKMPRELGGDLLQLNVSAGPQGLRSQPSDDLHHQRVGAVGVAVMPLGHDGGLRGLAAIVFVNGRIAEVKASVGTVDHYREHGRASEREADLNTEKQQFTIF